MALKRFDRTIKLSNIEAGKIIRCMEYYMNPVDEFAFTYLINCYKPVKNGFIYDWCISVTAICGQKNLPQKLLKILGKPYRRTQRSDSDIVVWDFGASCGDMWRDIKRLADVLDRKDIVIYDKRKNDNGYTVEVVI